MATTTPLTKRQCVEGTKEMTDYREVLYVLTYNGKIITPPYPFYMAEKVAEYIEYKLGKLVSIERQ